MLIRTPGGGRPGQADPSERKSPIVSAACLVSRKVMTPRNKPELMPGAAVKRIRAIGVIGRICRICTQSYIIGRVYETRSPCGYWIVTIGVTVIGSPPTVPPMSRSLRRRPKHDPRRESKGRDANQPP
jgi:hypothetical protein